MFIDIRTIGFAPTDAIRNHVECRLAAALGWAGDAIGRVTVRLDDINAGRGGVDKRCRIHADLRRPPILLTADAVDEDLYAAIDEAVLKVREAARRRLTRRVALQRKDPQRPGTLIPAGSS